MRTDNFPLTLSDAIFLSFPGAFADSLRERNTFNSNFITESAHPFPTVTTRYLVSIDKNRRALLAFFGDRNAKSGGTGKEQGKYLLCIPSQPRFFVKGEVVFGGFHP